MICECFCRMNCVRLCVKKRDIEEKRKLLYDSRISDVGSLIKSVEHSLYVLRTRNKPIRKPHQLRKSQKIYFLFLLLLIVLSKNGNRKYDSSAETYENLNIEKSQQSFIHSSLLHRIKLRWRVYIRFVTKSKQVLNRDKIHGGVWGTRFYPSTQKFCGNAEAKQSFFTKIKSKKMFSSSAVRKNQSGHRF